jgi:hypothetical protein
VENEILASAVVIVLSMALVIAQTAQLPDIEREFIRASLLAHIVSAAVLLYLMDYVFPESDSHSYIRNGGRMANLMWDDFGNWFPEVIRTALRLPHWFPNGLAGAQGATESMTAFVGMAMFLTSNASFAVQLALSIASFFGKWCLYRGLQETLPHETFRRPLLISTMLIPSIVLWTAGIVKESLAVTGLGIAVLGFSRLVRATRINSLATFALGSLLVMLIKPYLLFPLALACGAWFFAIKTTGRRAPKPIYIALAAAGAIAAVAGLGALFPEFSVDRIAESTAQQQQLGIQAGGGSAYSLGLSRNAGMLEQVLLAPTALVTTLMRPFLFEAHNFTSLLAASEMTALLALLLVAIRRNTFGSVRARIAETPLLLFALTFVVLGGVALGLATTNFGTLSRYRVPIMPFYVAFVLLLGIPADAWARATKPNAAPSATKLVPRRTVRAGTAVPAPR